MTDRDCEKRFLVVVNVLLLDLGASKIDLVCEKSVKLYTYALGTLL